MLMTTMFWPDLATIDCTRVHRNDNSQMFWGLLNRKIYDGWEAKYEELWRRTYQKFEFHPPTAKNPRPFNYCMFKYIFNKLSSCSLTRSKYTTFKHWHVIKFPLSGLQSGWHVAKTLRSIAYVILIPLWSSHNFIKAWSNHLVSRLWLK